MSRKKVDAHSIFTPGYPVSSLDLFKGRGAQIRRVIEAVKSPGRHPVLFGQRGVGKTSLVNLLEFFIEGTIPISVSCDSSDNFKTIWNRILSRSFLEVEQGSFGFAPKSTTGFAALSEYFDPGAEVTPSEVARVLGYVNAPAVFVLDEFDRVTDDQAKTYTADLIKHISDRNSLITLVLVGVGRSVSDLIGEHPSIIRNLVQIEMPKMSSDEIKMVLTGGFDQLLIETERDVLDEAARLTDGFPHYAHLLGLASARACERRGTKELTLGLFNSLACELAVEDSIETYRTAFTRATRTSQASRYPHMLCGCALAQHDDDGVFRATDVVEALNQIFNLETNIQRVTPALREFCSDERGPILEKVAVGSRSQYRFKEAMMRPFLRIRAKAFSDHAED